MVLLRYKTTFSIPEHANVRHFFILALYNILMRGSRNFRQGGGGGGGGVQVGLTDKKSCDVFFVLFFVFCIFFCFFLFKSSAYFTEVKWSVSKKSVIFQGSRGGPTFSRGGSNFFQGGGPDPLSPLWIRT